MAVVISSVEKNSPAEKAGISKGESLVSINGNESDKNLNGTYSDNTIHTWYFGFDNVESMQEAENLINGSFAKTMGYYTKNDGGASLYKIRTRTFEDIIDNGSIIEMNNESLVAELISVNINVKHKIIDKTFFIHILLVERFAL